MKKPNTMKWAPGHGPLSSTYYSTTTQFTMQVPVSTPEPFRSRIKMIAIGYDAESSEYHAGSTTYALTHDDRIFYYHNEDEGWVELPPLPV